MKIKTIVKALKEIKMLCEDKPGCRTCPFNAIPGGACIFTKGTLPQNWNLSYIDVNYDKEKKEDD